MNFSDRFNEWLTKQGKDPVDEDMGKALDEAALATSQFLRTKEAQEALRSGMAEIMDALARGEAVDPAEVARRKLDEAEEMIADHENRER